MSPIKYFILAGLVATSLTTVTYANAQSNDASSNAPAAAPSKKAIRQQNHQLERSVRHALAKAKNLDTSNITVLARSGAITLDGSAVDDGQIQLAESTAASVSGVASVKNNLHVREEGH
ncbi:BON domain-containing protein [Paraburkholderia sp. DHOC27]|uniref:BON domain-containing protein n=1 Tax=Paraburkholderia sp. DHOC27 TaxID=2303330 RepID=UPI000E3EB5B0|nr:BON domain-containing protein [Paraburkholderia sp. DHOC27]RFU49674.1 BON domain-containing protein [Paraburkholderia sp. DHOC27]